MNWLYELVTGLGEYVKYLWGLALFAALVAGAAIITHAQYESFFFGIVYGIAMLAIGRAAFKRWDRLEKKGETNGNKQLVEATAFVALILGALYLMEKWDPRFIYHWMKPND